MSGHDGRIAALEALLGGDAVAADGDGHVAVAPDRVGAISELMRWASREGVAVRTPPARPLGGRARFPGKDEVLLRLDRLHRALLLHAEAGTVDVAGGTTGAELAWQLHREGRWVAPRPRPFWSEPLGSYLAGPGLAAEWVAFGMWETPLMALEAVLLDGRVLRAGVAPRSAAGPDYRAFLLGIGDRIGVVTGATWRTSARSVPALFAARFPRRAAALQMLRAHVGRGVRPWASRVLRGRDPGRWNEAAPPGRGDHAVVLLCHRAEGARAELLRRLLHDETRRQGGTVLEPAEARAWYEGGVRAVCVDGAAALDGVDLAAGAGALATVWLATPWAGLGALWDELAADKLGRARVATLGEAFRPEGGILQVRLRRQGQARVAATTAVRALLERAAVHRARVAGVLDGSGRPVAPPVGDTPAAALIADVARGLAGETPPVLNPIAERGR